MGDNALNDMYLEIVLKMFCMISRKEYTTDLMNTSENEIVLTIDYAQNLSVLRHRVGGTFYLLFQYHFSVTSTTTSELCVTPLKVQ
jgi:hypothetical protein